jgi:peptidoglycan lytic transglycosylase
MDRLNVTRRANAQIALLLALGACVLAGPALASSGGAGLGGSAPKSNSTKGQVQSSSGKVRVSGNGFTVATRSDTLLRQELRFVGRVDSSAAGATIEIERRGSETGWQWANTAHDTAGPHGGFSAVWPTNHIGRFSIRAVVIHSKLAADASASPSLTITVYRPSIATWYGPGSWGSQTACGETLHRHTLGVANRTLPCGTQVALYYHGRTITVPVIDRGPYANHADWDLTQATSRALHTPGVAKIGAVSLPKS